MWSILLGFCCYFVKVQPLFSCLDRLITTPKAFGHHLKSPLLSFGLTTQYFIQKHQFPPQQVLNSRFRKKLSWKNYMKVYKDSFKVWEYENFCILSWKFYSEIQKFEKKRKMTRMHYWKKIEKKWKMDRIKFRNLYSSKVHSGIYQEFEKISNNEMVKKREFI